MVTTSATIKNKAGIHVRPSGIIIDTIKKYPGRITVKKNHTESALATAIDLLALGLLKGDTITIVVHGPGEQKFSEQLKTLFETEFDFPPRK
jgi:phosphocarrier protein HPr